MKVRAREKCEAVAKGDYGIFQQCGDYDPPAQFTWEGLGRTSWVYWHQVEIVPEEVIITDTSQASASPAPTVPHTTVPPALTQLTVPHTTVPPALTQPTVSRINIPLGPPILAMTNFVQRKRNRETWLSPPVYTHHRGYKICFRVDSNGWDIAKGTHVSVYVYFMKGEFDIWLKWPFRGVISFQLLDQANGTDHKTHSIVYDEMVEDKYCSRVISRECVGNGWGHSKFIAHSELLPKYLQNDTLLFQVHKVELRI